MMHDEHDSIEPEDSGERIDLPERVTEDTLQQSEAVGDVPRLPVTDELLREDVDRADSWLLYNKGLEQTGYAPADRLTVDAVDSLELEYTIETEGSRLEVNPVVVPSDPPVMYYTGQGAGAVHAVDARTGERYWQYRVGVGEDVPIRAYPFRRGVAVREDTVYLPTPTPEILALDRYTGERRWLTNLLVDGQIEDRVFVTQAPVAFDGRLFVGQSSDYATFTTMSALDADTGEIVWQRRTAPSEEWVDSTWEFSSAAAWMSPSVDPETETVLFAVGNPDPWQYGLVRPGPNRMSNSIVAVDAATGEVKWDTQICAHGLWDYDCHETPHVIDMEVDGEVRRVLITPWKAGWSYVIDVETGLVIERSEPFAKQDGPVFLDLPPAGEENKAEMYPPNTGATEWPPDAFSPRTGYQYVGAVDDGHQLWYEPGWQFEEYSPDETDAPRGFAVGGGFTSIPDHESRAYVAAIDVAAGEVVWRRQLDDVDPEWPPERLFTGGTTATAGDLVFHGSSGGTLFALHAETGEIVWRDDTGGRITASPIVWDDPAEECQYLAVAADDRIRVYAGG